LLFTGQIEESIKAAETALHFDPNLDIYYLWALGTAYFLAGRSADAARTLERLLARNANYSEAQVMIAAVYAAADRLEGVGRAAGRRPPPQSVLRPQQLWLALSQSRPSSQDRLGAREGGTLMGAPWPMGCCGPSAIRRPPALRSRPNPARTSAPLPCRRR